MKITVKVTKRDIKKGAPFIDETKGEGDDALVLAVKRALKRAGVKPKLKVEAWWGGEIKIGRKSYWPRGLGDMPDLYADQQVTPEHVRWMSTPRTFAIYYEDGE